MKKFNLVSKPFAHAYSSTWWKKSSNILWEYNTNDNPITFYIDGDLFQGINDKNNGKLKFLWNLESPQYNNNSINHIKNNLNDVLDTYELIFTYSDELLNLHPKFKFLPAGGFWIETPNIFEKTKLISMICSDKTKTELQQYRVDYAKKNKDNFDLYGHISNGIKNKEEGLKDYMFSICVENDDYNTYFTEKILDSFATGTIPIYKGTKNIINHFNGNGILFLDEINLDELTPELYYSKMEFVKENFEKVLASKGANFFVKVLTEGQEPLMKISRKELETFQRIADLAYENPVHFATLHAYMKPSITSELAENVCKARKIKDKCSFAQNEDGSFRISHKGKIIEASAKPVKSTSEKFSNSNYGTFGFPDEYVVLAYEESDPYSKIKKDLN